MVSCNSRTWMLCLHDFLLDTLVICICIACVCVHACLCMCAGPRSATAARDWHSSRQHSVPGRQPGRRKAPPRRRGAGAAETKTGLFKNYASCKPALTCLPFYVLVSFPLKQELMLENYGAFSNMSSVIH